MKTKEELNAIREEVKALNEKLHELTEEELEQVTGGTRCIVLNPLVIEMDEELKGRIIGREGRDIRSTENTAQ